MDRHETEDESSGSSAGDGDDESPTLDGRRQLLSDAARAGGELALESFREPLDVETKAGPLDSVTAVDRAVQRLVTERVADAFPDDVLVGEESVEVDVDAESEGSAAVDDAAETVPDSGYAWIVDPIDGTNNYVAGNRNWTTSVSLVRDGDPVAAVNRAPALGAEYAALDGEPMRDGEPCATSDRTDPSTFTVDPVFGLSPADRTGLAAVTGVVANRLGDLRRVGSGQLTLSMVAAGELDAAISTVPLPSWDTIAGVHLVRRAGGTVTDLDGDRWTRSSGSLLASNGEAHDALLAAFDGL